MVSSAARTMDRPFPHPGRRLLLNAALDAWDPSSPRCAVGRTACLCAQLLSLSALNLGEEP